MGKKKGQRRAGGKEELFLHPDALNGSSSLPASALGAAENFSQRYLKQQTQVFLFLFLFLFCFVFVLFLFLFSCVFSFVFLPPFFSLSLPPHPPFSL